MRQPGFSYPGRSHAPEIHAFHSEEFRLGGVVVIQETFGVNHHIRAVCDRLAAAGYAAVAPALFDRVEPGLSPAIRRTRYRLQCGLCRTLILEPSYVIHLLLSVS